MHASMLATWSKMFESLGELPYESDIPQKLLTDLKQRSLNSTARRIHLDGSLLFCGDKFVDLGNKAKIIHMFQTFINAKGRPLRCRELIRALFEQRDLNSMSKRQIACLQHNLVKLMSRGRSIVGPKLRSPDGFLMDWFVYNPKRRWWKLCEIRSEI